MARPLACTLALLVASWAAEARASPQEVLGFGYRSIAMGNTAAAVGEGVDSVYGNPALLSLSRQTTLELGLQGASFHLHASGGPSLVPYSSLEASTLGGVLPLPFGGVLKNRVALGLGFVTPLDVVVRGRILYPDRPQYLLADRVQSVAVQAALGIDIGYGVRIGGGFAALAALTGSVVVATDASGRIGTTVEDTLIASYAPLVGASYDIGDAYRIGLTFRGELVGRFNVVITAESLGAITIPPLNISGVAQYDPWQLHLEAARIKGPWRMAAAVVYKHWQAYPGPVEATVRCEDAGEPGLECGAPTPADMGYGPGFSPRVGVERHLGIGAGATVKLRGGYAFELSPAPEQRGPASYFDNHRSVFSLGYGVHLAEPRPPLGFDGFVQLQVLHAREHDKSVADGAPFDATVSTHGLVVAAGVSGSVRF